ncbi:Dihydropyrimidinase protein 5 [Paragonimus heterotremus]|uniref:dihydropyrimidinase n=1 Tax=Paragonimus heterotremus TaxID=100268 RepID=A0A8J4WWB5_9TREM|nr:Dihydropyrimidinase protein 5 [Paragonimus heterotremus]
MSHRRESGAVPPWVVPEPSPRKRTSHSEIQQKDTQNSRLSNDDRRVSGPGAAEEIRKSLASGDTHENQRFRSQNQYLHIIGGEVVNNDYMQNANILIENGKILLVGKKLDVPKNIPTIDASDLLIMPGGIDIGTYIQNDMFAFDENDYTSTIKEALLGGTTTLVDTVICPRGRLPVDILCRQKNRTKNCKLWCNIIYRVGLLEINDAILDQFESLVKQHDVNSFLFFVSEHETKESGGISLSGLKPALLKCRHLGALALIRNVTAWSSTDSPVFGSNVTSETQYPSPFLPYLTTGDIMAVSSDQAGTNRSMGSARLGAVGQRLVAVWEAGVPSGWLDPTAFVSVISANAARYTGLYPCKGRISPGSDADLVLWPSNSLTQSGTGRPTMVLLRGQVMAREGKLANVSTEVGPYITVDGSPQETNEPQPSGEVLKTQPFPMTVYSAVLATDRLRRRYPASTSTEPWSMKTLTGELEPCTPTVEKVTENEPQDTSSPTVGPLSGAPKSPEPAESFGVRMVHGHRDLHASGFSLSGAQVDDNRPQRSGIRTSQPPGGQSRNPLW